MPRDAFVQCTENGSMEIQILEVFMKRVDTFLRKRIPAPESNLLAMDGHSSRKGIQWVMNCEENDSIPVLKPENTSQILQPCAKRINKAFKV